MKIKICGLFRHEDIEYVNEAIPDYIGFVFADSKRRVTAKQAAALKKELNPVIAAVGVFVNAPAEEVADLLNEGIIGIAQLHGTEDEAYIERLRHDTQSQIIKAIRVDTPEDIYAAQNSPADFLLLDHGSGGTGRSFDWSFVGDSQKPFFLAGGIHAGNLGLAMSAGKPYAIDISSGAESDGVKDREKILELVRRVKNG